MQYQNIIELLNDAQKKYANLPAFTSMGQSLTYTELLHLSQSFGGFLQSKLKLKPQEKIAIMLPNCLQHPIAVYGSLMARLCIVNVNPLYTPDELHHQLEDSQATTIIVLENMAHVVEKAKKGTKIKHIIVTRIGDMHGHIKGALLNFAVKYLKKMVPPHQLKFIAFKSIFNKKHALIKNDILPTDLAFLQYTGGTTGRSKGAMLTHSNICANIHQAQAIVPEKLYQANTTILTALPLYHIFALMVSFITLSYGGKNLLIINAKDINSLITAFKSEPIHGLPVVNTLMVHLLHHPKFNGINFQHLRATISGGMSTQTAIAKQWQKVTGCVVNEGYGLSETSPIIALSNNHNSFSGNVGQAAPLTEIRIADPNDHALDPDCPGEIQVRGPQVMQGYWNVSTESKEHPFTKDGWFKTGDIGSLSATGHLTILDRLKDMIIVSGFNVYPNEVENVLVQHPKITECGVVAVKDENGDEIVKAFIVNPDHDLSAEDVRKYCYQYLTHYKVPKIIEFIDELPKSAVGKVLRRKLKTAA
ncbi:MAG: AMP-binding protein [Gammaproteobacteria bacterium]|nr:AMP-binding protein [Gammaproteobacteria bacterium]